MSGVGHIVLIQVFFSRTSTVVAFRVDLCAGTASDRLCAWKHVVSGDRS